MTESSATLIDQTWRKEPPPSAFAMCDAGYAESIFPPSGRRGYDKARMAAVLDCDFTQVRMHTYYAVWAPEDAEAEWRENRCQCDEQHHRDNGFEGCTTTKPAERLDEFWDEDGTYCPWVTVKRGTPGAVAFLRGEAAYG